MPPITAIAGKTLSIKCPAAGFPLEWPIVWEKGLYVALFLPYYELVNVNGHVCVCVCLLC